MFKEAVWKRNLPFAITYEEFGNLPEVPRMLKSFEEECKGSVDILETFSVYCNSNLFQSTEMIEKSTAAYESCSNRVLLKNNEEFQSLLEDEIEKCPFKRPTKTVIDKAI